MACGFGWAQVIMYKKGTGSPEAKGQFWHTWACRGQYIFKKLMRPFIEILQSLIYQYLAVSQKLVQNKDAVTMEC